MKRLDISRPCGVLFLSLSLILILSSCQRSSFTTSIRHTQNGRVSYSNRHHLLTRNFAGKKKIKNVRKAEKKESGSTIHHLYSDIKKLESSPIVELQLASVHPSPLITLSTRKEYLPEPSTIKNKRQNHQKISVPDSTQNNERPLPSDSSGSKKKVEKLALAGFIISVPGLVPGFGLPLAIAGLVLGIKGLRKINRNRSIYKGRGFAIAAICLGALGIALTLFSLGTFIVMSIELGGGV